MSYYKVRKGRNGKEGVIEGRTMPRATLTSKGQLVIPKAIREQMGLRPGDKLDFVLQDNGDVLIRPAVQDVRRLKGMLHRPGREPVSVEAMNQVVQQRGRSA